MIFSSLDLSTDLQKAIDACGYSKMTPIQEQAIIPARRGKDLLAIAQTGTGKTAAFSIPIIQRLIDKPRLKGKTGPRVLILTPTRELAEQLATTIGEYIQFLDLSITAIYGGTKKGGQIAKLKAGVDILVATPGRLIDHLSAENIGLSSVEYTVLDECDRMLDMGFVADVKTLLERTSEKRQTLLFSATLSPAVNELAHKILHSHQEIRANKETITADTVDEVIYPIDEGRKIDLFVDLLVEHNWFQVLVFTSTKEQANRLIERLSRYPAAACHGDMRQGARRRAMTDFREGKIQILVATEVAARGIDIQGLEYVLNFNLPFLAEDYVHRIGRVGRAGSKGHAISFVSREEERSLDDIQRLIGYKIKRIHRKGFDVNNRDNLISKVSEASRSSRKNKITQTNINGASEKKAAPKKSKPLKGKAKKGKKKR